MSVFFFYTFLLSYISFYEMEHRNNVNPSLFMQLAKVQEKNEWKKKPGVSEYGPGISNWTDQ